MCAVYKYSKSSKLEDVMYNMFADGHRQKTEQTSQTHLSTTANALVSELGDASYLSVF